MDLKQGKITGDRYKLKYKKNKPVFGKANAGSTITSVSKGVKMDYAEKARVSSAIRTALHTYHFLDGRSSEYTILHGDYCYVYTADEKGDFYQIHGKIKISPKNYNKIQGLIKKYGTDRNSQRYFSSLKHSWSEARRKGSNNANALYERQQISDDTVGMGVSELRYRQQPISDNGGNNSQGISDLQNKEYETVEDYINQNYKEPYYHASPERVISPRNNGRFGSALFFTSSDTNSRGIGNHVIDKADLKTTTSKNIYNDYDYSSDEDVKAFAKSYGIDEDTAFDIITERKNAYKNIDDKYDVGEADWDAQSLLLKIAKKMGYEAVEAEDENGAVLIADVNAASRTMKSTEDIYEYITGEREEDNIRFSVVQDEKLPDELENGENVKVGDEVDATGFDEYLDERAEAEGITSKEDIKKAKELAKIAKKKAIGEKYLKLIFLLDNFIKTKKLSSRSG